MSHPQLPCIDCITFSICRSVYNEDKQNVFRARENVTSRCRLLAEYMGSRRAHETALREFHHYFQHYEYFKEIPELI